MSVKYTGGGYNSLLRRRMMMEENNIDNEWDYELYPDSDGLLPRTILEIPENATGFIIKASCSKLGGVWIYDCRGNNGWGSDLTYSEVNDEWNIGINIIDKSSFFEEKGIYGNANRTMYLGSMLESEKTVYIDYFYFKWIYK